MSLCTRCGKERIVISSYKEKVDKAIVTYSITACPDPECQKQVNKNLKNEEARRTLMKEDQERRVLQRAAEKARTTRLNRV